jgi:CxxC motif-containing protein (DUF1111 family)
MKQTYRTWYVLAALLALVPAGARMLLWHRARPRIVDQEMARAGEVLFKHEWQPHDSLSPGGDGLGPVFNAVSCVACHHQGGPGGGGGLEHNVTTFTAREALGREAGSGTTRVGVVHTHGLAYQETLRDIHSDLPAISQPSLEQLGALRGSSRAPLTFPPGVFVSQRNTPALFGARLIDEIPERVIVAGEKAQRMKWGMALPDDEDKPVGRAPRLGGHLGRFGWKAQTVSLGDFVQAACANELGLGNPKHAQPRPLGRSAYKEPGLDLTAEQCDQLTAFVSSLPRPTERLPDNPAARAEPVAGRKLFDTVGCTDCHTPNLGSVEGIYSDLLLHRMGQELVGGGYYGDPPLPLPDGTAGEGPAPSEWRTPPLWGVADSAPYLHDGRAETLDDAIRQHSGQGRRAALRFEKLTSAEQTQLVAFLKSLRAP